MMQIRAVGAGRFKLDGGAMFGVVPKRMWQRLNPADEENMCTWALRSMLIETGNRKILVDTGIGHKQGDRFRAHFYPHGKEIEASLQELGLQPEDITDVFLTHFHFDHVGGALKHDDQGKTVPTFPRATYWSNEQHYQYALHPNPREAASFLPENFVPLKELGVLEMLPYQEDDLEWLPGIKVRFVHGHTEAQMILLIDNGAEKYIFCADLIPSTWHIRLPYIMAYDMQPMRTLEEKQRVLNEAIEADYQLFFEHDPVTPSCHVERDERGRYRPSPA